MPAPKDPEKYEEWKSKLSEAMKFHASNIPKRGNWTEEEDATLKEHYFSHTIKDLTLLLPDRSKEAIKMRLRTLGLQKSNPPEPLDPEIMMKEKRCTKCGEFKPLSMYSHEVHHKRKKGFRSACKSCESKRRMVWRERKKGEAAINARESKECHLCGQLKNIDEFSYDSVRNDKRSHWCKDCQRNYYYDPKTTMANKRFRPLVHLPSDPMLAKVKRLKYQYGITGDQYLAMLESQNGVCASCGNPETVIDPRTKQIKEFLVVDHDHSTGMVRALLCNNCNVALGFLQDDPVRIEALLIYCRKVNQQGAEHSLPSTQPYLGKTSE